MRFDIITIFPEVLQPYLNASILKRAQEKRLVRFSLHNLRRWTTDSHRTVDDKPYGGGP
ncbi:MAG: tRNA (guanosine(37)-N1)-methyltransferase TrmD, partial [Candidatus Terrybacteria bacterium]|nr:tRNA (guanosine(37)-N1)-methyltransferase TrmD [Candidatus Terrybacteria bacterium]